MTEQRKYRRAALPVSFGERDRMLTGVVLDISREGCRIHCTDPFTDLLYFQVQIRLVELQETLEEDLAVRRWARNGDLGVEFIRLEPAQQARLRWVILNWHAAPPSPPKQSYLPA